MMNTDIRRLLDKVTDYKTVLQNTHTYREAWKKTTKEFITGTLKLIIQQTGLKASVNEKNSIENLEAVILDLGRSSSGIAESLDDTDVRRIMIKNNGAIIYQQLFNGKIMVMIVSPYIEEYGEAKPPASLAIVRPDEISENSIFGHVERMLDAIIEWEDYDDDDKRTKIAFQPIGFKHTVNLNDGNGNQHADASKQ